MAKLFREVENPMSTKNVSDTTTGTTLSSWFDQQAKAKQAEVENLNMRVEANNMLAEEERNMKIDKDIEVNKSIDPTLIAKMSQQGREMEGSKYVSPGSEFSPRYGGSEYEGTGMNSAMIQAAEREKYGDRSIATMNPYDYFDEKGDIVTNRAKGKAFSVIGEGLSDTKTSLARAAIGMTMMGNDIMGYETQGDYKNLATSWINELNDEQLAKAFYNQTVYVRNNANGKVERKTYGDLANDVEKFGSGIVKGLPEQVAVGILSVMTGGLAGGGYYFSKTAGEEYAKLRSEGVDQSKAFAVSFAKAGIEGLGDFAFGAAASKLPGSKALKGKAAQILGVDALLEGTTETLQGIGTNAVDKYMMDKDVNLTEGALENFAGGMLTGPIVGGLGRTASTLTGGKRSNVKKVDSGPDLKVDVDKLNELNKDVKDVKDVKVEDKVEAEPVVPRAVKPKKNTFDPNLKIGKDVPTPKLDVVDKVKGDEVSTKTKAPSVESNNKLKEFDAESSDEFKEYVKLKTDKTRPRIPRELNTTDNVRRMAQRIKLQNEVEKSNSRPAPKVEDNVKESKQMDNVVTKPVKLEVKKGEVIDVETSIPTSPKLKATVTADIGTHKSNEFGTEGEGRNYPNQWSSESFTARHYPERGVTKIKDHVEGRWYPFKQNTQMFDNMVSENKGIGKWYNQTARTSEALTDKVADEREFGGTPLTVGDRKVISTVDRLAKVKDITRGNSLSPGVLSQLDKMNTRLIGNLITSAKESKLYSDKDVALLSKYYNENYSKNKKIPLPEDNVTSTKSDKKKKDDNDKPTPPSSGTELKDRLTKLNDNVVNTFHGKTVENVSSHLNELSSIINSKYYKARGYMKTKVQNIYNRLKRLVRNVLNDDVITRMFDKWVDSNPAIATILDPKQMGPVDKIKSVNKNTEVRKYTSPSTVSTFKEVLDGDEVGRLSSNNRQMLEGIIDISSETYVANLAYKTDMKQYQDNADRMAEAIRANDELSPKDRVPLNKLIDDVRKENSRLNSERRDDLIDRVYKANEGLTAPSLSKFASDKSLPLGKRNYYQTMINWADRMGAEFADATFRIQDDARSKHLYLTEKFDAKREEFIKRKDVLKVAEKYSDNNLSDITGSPVIINENTVGAKVSDDISIPLGSLVTIANFDGNLGEDATMSIMLPNQTDLGSDRISITHEQLADIQDYYEKLIKKEPLIKEFNNVSVGNSRDMVNMLNAYNSIANLYGTDKVGHIETAFPIPFVATKENTEDGRVTLESAVAKSFMNNYDESKDLNNRTYVIRPVEIHLKNLSNQIAEIMSYESVIPGIQKIMNDHNIKRSITDRQGLGTLQGMQDWVKHQVKQYSSDVQSNVERKAEGLASKLTNKSYLAALAFNAKTPVLQLASAGIASYPIYTELQRRGYNPSVKDIASNAVLLKKNMLKAMNARFADLTVDVSGKSKDTVADLLGIQHAVAESTEGKQVRDRLYKTFVPQIYERGKGKSTVEMKAILKDAHGVFQAIGTNKKGKVKKTALGLLKLVKSAPEKAMGAITGMDMAVMDAIWTTNASILLKEYSKKGAIVNPAVKEYVESKGKLLKVTPKSTIKKLNDYLDSIDEGGDAFLSDVASMTMATVNMSQPVSEAHAIPTARYLGSAWKFVNAFQTQKMQNIALTGRVIGDALDDYAKHGSKKMLMATIMAGVSTVALATLEIAGITEFYNDIFKTEAEASSAQSGIADKGLDVAMSTSHFTDLPWRMYRAISDGGNVEYANVNNNPHVDFIQNMIASTPRNLKKLSDGELTATQAIGNIALDMSAMYMGYNYDRLVQYIKILARPEDKIDEVLELWDKEDFDLALTAEEFNDRQEAMADLLMDVADKVEEIEESDGVRAKLFKGDARKLRSKAKSVYNTFKEDDE